MATHQICVQHSIEHRRFEAVVDGLLCVADYQLEGSVMRMTHTCVPSSLEGRGIASALVMAAFEFAALNGNRILPLCSYVAAWAKRHPDSVALLA
jgi:predicted GNAT family acetyltransferase